MHYDSPTMADDFLAQFIGNAPKAKLLRLFVLNPDTSYTLAQAAKQTNITALVAGRELRALENIDFVKKRKYSVAVGTEGRRVEGKQAQDTWTFNAQHRHANALSKFIHEISPIQHSTIIDTLRRSGRLTAVILSGSFMGDSTRPADMLLVVENVNEGRLEQAVRRLEPLYGREIRYAVFTTPEFRYRLTIHDRLVRDTLDFPHLILLDKAKLL